MVFLYDWKRWQIVANADNSYHKQKIFLVNILICTLHDWVKVLFIIILFIYYD